MTNAIIRMSYTYKQKVNQKKMTKKVFLFIKISLQPDENFPQIICVSLQIKIFHFLL